MSGEPKGEGLPNVLEFLDKARALIEADRAVNGSKAVDTLSDILHGKLPAVAMLDEVTQPIEAWRVAWSEFTEAFKLITPEEVKQL